MKTKKSLFVLIAVLSAFALLFAFNSCGGGNDDPDITGDPNEDDPGNGDPNNGDPVIDPKVVYTYTVYDDLDYTVGGGSQIGETKDGSCNWMAHWDYDGREGFIRLYFEGPSDNYFEGDIIGVVNRGGNFNGGQIKFSAAGKTADGFFGTVSIRDCVVTPGVAKEDWSNDNSWSANYINVDFSDSALKLVKIEIYTEAKPNVFPASKFDEATGAELTVEWNWINGLEATAANKNDLLIVKITADSEPTWDGVFRFTTNPTFIDYWFYPVLDPAEKNEEGFYISDWHDIKTGAVLVFEVLLGEIMDFYTAKSYDIESDGLMMLAEGTYSITGVKQITP